MADRIWVVEIRDSNNEPWQPTVSVALTKHEAMRLKRDWRGQWFKARVVKYRREGSDE